MLDQSKKGNGQGRLAGFFAGNGNQNDPNFMWTQPPQNPAGTGGNNQPQVKPPQGTGGNLPPNMTRPPAGTGGNLPANPTNPQGTGGNLPPDVTRPPVQGNGGNQQPILDPITGQPVPQTAPQQNLQGGFSPVNVVTDTLGQIIDPNGAYMRNAQRRGLEQAAAGGNRAGGSIAAGAASRSMMEAAQPLVNNALQLQGQREQFAFQGEQNQLERNRDYTQAQLQNWMDSNKFNREFYGALSMMPIQSAYQLNSLIQTYALENPDVYTADVISGMTNFFNQNFSQILSTLMPSVYGGGNRGTNNTQRGGP